MTQSRKRVLVVDDDELIRDMLCFMLTENGYLVESAVNGGDGLTKACASAFDVILLDNMMPGMTGVHLAKQLLFLGCIDRSRIIMITGGAVPEDTESYAALVLKKPFDIDELLRAMRECEQT